MDTNIQPDFNQNLYQWTMAKNPKTKKDFRETWDSTPEQRSIPRREKQREKPQPEPNWLLTRI